MATGDTVLDAIQSLLKSHHSGGRSLPAEYVSTTPSKSPRILDWTPETATSRFRRLDLAQRVWGLPEVREGIFKAMTGRDRIIALLLSRSTFYEAVKAMYQVFDGIHLNFLQRRVSSPYRYRLYIDAVRTVTINMPNSPESGWLKSLLFTYRHLRHIRWTWSSYSSGVIACLESDDRGSPRLKIVEEIAPILSYTGTQTAEFESVGLGCPIELEIPPNWPFTFHQKLNSSLLRPNMTTDVPLLDVWTANVPRDTDIIDIPWVVPSSCLANGKFRSLPRTCVPRALRAPVAFSSAGAFKQLIVQLPRSLKELHISRPDKLFTSPSYPPPGGLLFVDFLDTVILSSPFEWSFHLQTLSVQVYHEALRGCHGRQATTLGGWAQYCCNVRPPNRPRVDTAACRMVYLTTLRIDVVLPLSLARALETYRHDSDFGVLILLADLIIPSKETVSLLLSVCAPECRIVLQIVSPLPTTNKENRGATLLSQVVMDGFESTQRSLLGAEDRHQELLDILHEMEQDEWEYWAGIQSILDSEASEAKEAVEEMEWEL